MKKLLKIITLILAFCSIVVVFSACSSCQSGKNSDTREDVDIEVYHPVTGELIEAHQTYEFEYDGEPKIFSVKLKSEKTGKYLDNENFDGNSWKQYVSLLIRYDGDAAYTDEGIDNWETDWPSEPGDYEIELKFNELYPLSFSNKSDKYYSARFYFTLKIV